VPKLQQLKSLQFMAETQLSRKDIRHYKRPEIVPVATFKNYPSAPRVPLPRNWALKEARISPILQNRRSRRSFSQKPLTLQSLAYMLWAGQGITATAGNHRLRTSPSAGALYPIETYISAQNIDELPAGIYHFNVAEFELELLVPGSQADEIALACLNQQFLASAAAIFIWTTVYRRNVCKYGDRGLRYIFTEVGHLCQNVLLAAEATGNNACPVAAFFDNELNQLIEVDGKEESVIYLAGVGARSEKLKG